MRVDHVRTVASRLGSPKSGVGLRVGVPCALLLCVLIGAPVSTQTPRFYSDDPIAREPASRDASGVQPWDIGLMYELATNLFVTAKLQAVEHPGAEHQHDRRGARLELVHEPDRLDGGVGRRGRARARASGRRPPRKSG